LKSSIAFEHLAELIKELHELRRRVQILEKKAER